MAAHVEWEASFKTGLGEILRELRRNRGLSQEALAEASGVSINHISLIERGLTTPTLLLLFQIAAALQVSTTEIVRRVEDQIPFRSETAEGEPSD